MKSILETAREALSGDIVGQVSSLVHESESNTRRGLEEAVPVSLAGLASSASTEEGAQALLKTFREGSYPHVYPEDLGRTVSDATRAEQVVSSSEGAMSRLFGNRLGGIVEGLAGGAGISRSSASKLLGLAMPLVMGIVGKTAAARNMDARGLSGFLGEQFRQASGAMSGRLSGMFGLSPAFAGTAGAVTTTRHPERIVEVPHLARPRPSIMPWLLAGMALLAGMFWLSGRTRHRARPVATTPPAEVTPRPTQSVGRVAPVQPTAPAQPAEPAPATTAQPVEPAVGAAIRVLSGPAGLSAVSAAIEGTEPLPVRFVAADLRFTHDSAVIEAPTDKALDEVGAALQAHPSARMRVEGHTDNTGDLEANVILSQQRANAVKSYLTGHGAAAGQVEATGYGQNNPLATNDTPEGRAQNRRTELVLVSR